MKGIEGRKNKLASEKGKKSPKYYLCTSPFWRDGRTDRPMDEIYNGKKIMKNASRERE